jgi:hypothetical protein
MAKRKKVKNPTKDDLPKNPEFQRFAAFTGAILQVSKDEVGKILAEERTLKERVATEIEEITERIESAPNCEPA